MNAAVTGTSQAPSPTQWQIDPAHSAAHFSVRHLMISNVRGEFSQGQRQRRSRPVRSHEIDRRGKRGHHVDRHPRTATRRASAQRGFLRRGEPPGNYIPLEDKSRPPARTDSK